MSANRAGSANSVRGLSGGSVLWQPTIAEKRRTDEQTSTQKPFGGVLGQERNFGIHLYGRHEARWKTENLMPKNSRQEACAVKAYWCPFQCFRIESTTYFDPTSASQFNDQNTVASGDAVGIPRRGGNHFDGNKSPALRLTSTMHALTIFIQRPYRQALRLKPNYVEALNNRGITYDHKGQYDAAMADYDHAIQIDPTDADVFRNRASLHRRKGEYDLSIPDATEAIRLKPDYADAFVTRGLAHSLKFEYDLAIADFSHAIRLQPGDAIAFYDRGNEYNATDQYKLAVADYAEDIRLQPDDADGWNSRCWTRAIAGELVQALNDCDQSLILRPSHANSLDSRGFTYLKLGRFDLAILDYNAALAVNPKLAESLFGRGLAERKSNPVKAKSDVTAALTIKPQVIAEFR
jgi:tetratricopeptide (TPR) repeat protein